MDVNSDTIDIHMFLKNASNGKVYVRISKGVYEGISGFEHFRAELGLMYFAAIDPASGRLAALHLTPLRQRPNGSGMS